MTKAEIITRIYEKVGFSKKDATDVVEATFDIIKSCLERGEKVKISGFGNFVVNTKRPRKGRNPQTGDEIIIVGRKVLTFKASQIMKKSLNGMPPRLPEKIYFKIGEVSEIVGVEPYVLRYWETEFDLLKPSKAPSKHRLYKKRDVELLLEIKRLLYTEGFTIEGARKKLKEAKKEEKDQLKLPLAEQKYKSALVKLKKDLESLRRLLS